MRKKEIPDAGLSEEIRLRVRDSTKSREKRAAKVLKGVSKRMPKQFFFLVMSVVIIFAVITANNIWRFNALSRSNAGLQTELTALKASNEARTPLIWQNRDSERILRDYERLDAEYKRLFTFRTIQDMSSAKSEAVNFGLSETTVNMLYNPDEFLTQDVLTGTNTAEAVNCYYSGSDIYLIGIYDDCYSYMSRISMDILADSDVTLIMFLDIDADGKILRDVCYVSSLPTVHNFG